MAGYAIWLERKPSAWSEWGWYSGILSAVIMVALGLIGVRKRSRTRQTGSLATWARVHSVLGGLFYGVALFHAGYQATSTLSALLLSAVTLVCILGVVGQVVNFVVPKLLVRTEDAATLPEDVNPEMEKLALANKELMDAFDSQGKKEIKRTVNSLIESGFVAFIKGYSPAKIDVLIYERSRNLPNLSESHFATALRVAQNTYKYRLWKVRTFFETIMSAWVPMHLVTSCLAFLFLIGHILTVALW